MPLNTEVPQWLVDTSKWIAASGERNVGEFFAGAQAVQQLSQNAIAIQAAKNNLAIQPAMNLLKLQEMQIGVEEQKISLDEIHQDQQSAAAWMQERQNNPDAPEPAWKSQKYQMQSWQRQRYQDALDVKKSAIENNSLASKIAQADNAAFLKDLQTLSPTDRAYVRSLPSNKDGTPSVEQAQYAATHSTTKSVPSESPLGKLRADRQKALDAGDEEAVAQYDAAIQEQISNKGRSIYMGQDDQGKPIFEITEGGAKSRLGSPTVATQSQAQQKLLRYENTVELLNRLDSTLKPEHIGASGLAGEWLVDRGMAQLVPEMSNKERVTARATLVAAREGLMRELSNDTRFSNADREEIASALPSSGIFESLPDAKQKIDTVRNIIMTRSKVYAKGLGQKPPVWALTPDEIKAEYQKFLNTNGKEGIDLNTAKDTLMRFH